MKIYFRVDQKAAMAARINAANRDVVLDVDPSKLSEEEAKLLAERLGDYPEKDGSLMVRYRVGLTTNISTGLTTTPVVAKAPTIEAVLTAIRLEDEAVAQQARAEAADKAAESAARREKTLAILRERKTTTDRKYLAMPAKEPSIHYDILVPDWPYVSDSAVVNFPEAKAWLAELEAANAKSLAEAEDRKNHRLMELAQLEEARRVALAQFVADRNAWIKQHGSRRLQRMLAEDIECDATYRDERLAAERPGWSWTETVPGSYDDPRNPSEEAFALLDEARKVDPAATLAYWTVEHTHDENCAPAIDGDCPKYDYTGYVAVSEFLGREVAYGLQDLATKQ